MSQRLILEVVGGSLRGQSFDVAAKNTLLVGRLPECGISVPQDLTVSRQHFRIDFYPPDCVLVHLSQTGETLVNGKSVGQLNLRDGDDIKFGSGNSVRVRFEEAAPGVGSNIRPVQAAKPASSEQFETSAVSCGWNIYHSLTPKLGIERLLEILGQSGPMYALVDFSRTKKPLPAELIDSQYLFPWIDPKLAAKFSPLMIAKAETPDFVEIVQDGWGGDGIVCFGSTLSAPEALAHWRQAIGVVDDKPGTAMTAYYMPSLLNQILTCQANKQVAPLLCGLTWLVLESAESPGNWSLYSDEMLTSVLTSAGLVLQDAKATAH